VVIFEEKAKFTLTVPLTPEPDPGAGENYQLSLQGEKYGCFGVTTECPDTPVGFPSAISADQ
jgi:hypothetical protein